MISPAEWAKEKVKSLGMPEFSPSHIERLSGDDTREEKEGVLVALRRG